MSTKFCLIENDGFIKVDISGKGGELVEVLTNAIKGNEQIKQLIMMSIVGVMIEEEQHEQEDDNQLAEMLSKMKIGLA